MRNYIFLISLALFLGCKDDNTVNIKECGVLEPMEELPWMESLKNSLTNCSCVQSIFQATYQGEEVFFVLMNDPLCNGVFATVLYNCQGNPVKSFAYPDDNISEFNEKVRDQKVLYSCEKS